MPGFFIYYRFGLTLEVWIIWILSLLWCGGSPAGGPSPLDVFLISAKNWLVLYVCM